MRKKSRAGKPGLFQILPQPSVISLSSQFVGPSMHPDRTPNDNRVNEANSDTLCSMVPESSDIGHQDATHQKQTPNAIDDMPVEKESSGKGPEGIHRPELPTQGPDAMCSTIPELSGDGGQNTNCQKQNLCAIDDLMIEEESRSKGPEDKHGLKFSSEIEWSEKECIKCDGGGKLLVCSDSNCPLAVHEECMQCSPHFDRTGKFFCPYCSYKQVMLATRKAKKKAKLAKKALSVFLGERKLDGDIGGAQMEKADMLQSSEQNLQVKEKVDNFCDRVQEDRSEERSDRACRTSAIPCNGTLSSTGNEQHDTLDRCYENGRPDDGDDSHRDKEAAHTFDIEGVSGSVPQENPKILDDFQIEMVVQHHREVTSMGKRRKLGVEPEKSVEGKLDDAETEEEGNPEIVNDFQNKRADQHDQEVGVVEKEMKLGNEPEKPMEGTLDNAEIEEDADPEILGDFQNKIADQHDQEVAVRDKEKKLVVEPETPMEGKSDKAEVEVEEMQAREQEAGGPSSDEDNMERDDENDEVASDSFDGGHEGVLQSARSAEKKCQNVKSANGECSRSLARELSFKGNVKEEKRVKSNLRSKSRRSITPTIFPNVKRKRTPWTAEEEEMLKEGVGRFSTKVNKNLPWKKILDFGRHVFHWTRTPEHLRNKWRNLPG